MELTSHAMCNLCTERQELFIRSSVYCSNHQLPFCFHLSQNFSSVTALQWSVDGSGWWARPYTILAFLMQDNNKSRCPVIFCLSTEGTHITINCDVLFFSSSFFSLYHCIEPNIQLNKRHFHVILLEKYIELFVYVSLGNIPILDRQQLNSIQGNQNHIKPCTFDQCKNENKKWRETFKPIERNADTFCYYYETSIYDHIDDDRMAFICQTIVWYYIRILN